MTLKFIAAFHGAGDGLPVPYVPSFRAKAGMPCQGIGSLSSGKLYYTPCQAFLHWTVSPIAGGGRPAVPVMAVMLRLSVEPFMAAAVYRFDSWPSQFILFWGIGVWKYG